MIRSTDMLDITTHMHNINLTIVHKNKQTCFFPLQTMQHRNV